VEIAKITKTPTFEVTKKAKKLHQRMISYNYLNEFSYNKFINEL